MKALSQTETERMTWAISGVVAIWGAAVVAGAETSFFASLYLPLIAVIVAATIIVPTLIYFASPRCKPTPTRSGTVRFCSFTRGAFRLRWRSFGMAFRESCRPPSGCWPVPGISSPAATPPTLCVNQRARRCLSFHVFGFADFVVAVGTGLTFTLLQDPRMALIDALPMALIPLWGVGISGVTHLIAFDMLRRGIGRSKTSSHTAAIAA